MVASRIVVSSLLFTCLIFLPEFPFPCPAIIYAAGIQDSKIGISGTSGDDTLANTSYLDLLSELQTSSPEDVTTAATGMDGLAGNDSLTNGGIMDLDAHSVVDVPYAATQTFGGTATSTTAGILGGDGRDSLTNAGPIYSTADSSTFFFEVIFQIDPGLFEEPASAVAAATGLQGGNNADSIDNGRVIEAEATSNSEVQESHISAVDIPLEVFALGDGKTTATSTSIAIDGDMQTGTPAMTPGDTETISNSGALTALATADATKLIGMIELLGAARVDDSTEAKAYSAGIFGGVNDTIVTNTGTIDVDAVSDSEMTSWEIKMKGLMAKPAMDLFGLDVGKYKTTADALAVGISGNTGDDGLGNYGSGGAGSIDVSADADAISKIFTFSISPPISLEAPVAGLAVSSLSLPDLALVTTSDPALGNGSVAAYGDARTVATANAFGMTGYQGEDSLENDVTLSSVADAYASNLTLSVDINIDKKSFLPLPGAAVADASTTAIAVSGGLDGGAGNDTVTNTAAVNATATAEANSVGIAATIKGSMEGLNAGVAVTDSSSAAISSAKGISGGTGGDTIANSAAVTAYSEAQDKAVSVSVTLAGDKVGVAAGVSLADASSRANANSYGIDAENAGGDETASSAGQIDDIANTGEISSTSVADSHANTVGVSLGASLEGIAVSVSLTDTDVKSEARATGIRSGIGEDLIDNAGAGGIHATSTATSESDSVSVSVDGAYKGVAMGASYAEANTEASAGAVGIDSGDSNDTITNQALIDTSSTANVDSDTVSVNASVAIYGFSAGVAMSNAQTNATADSSGIDAGNGNDTVTNTAVMTTNATATSTTDTVTIDFAEAGAAIADVSSDATATSTGIKAGNGRDAVTNEGTLGVSALSVVDDTSTTVNLAGYAKGDVGSTSTASAFGIAGGEGTSGETAGDTLINDTAGNINVVSTANAYADNSVIQGGGLLLTGVGSKTDASAVAIVAGALGDTIENYGTASATAISDIHASSFSFQLSGVQAGSVGINAVGTARGIDAGDGENTITNEIDGSISTYADLNVLALNTEAGFGGQFVHSGVTSDARTQGIISGADIDTIDNYGTIAATANSYGAAGGGSIGLFSASLVNALASADIEGINAGANNDTITNNGTITAGSIAAGDSYLVKAETAGVALDFASLVFSTLGSEAEITGIQGASGNDTITNNGTIYIGDEASDDGCTSDRCMAIGESYSFAGQWLGMEFAFSGSSARTTSIGIDGGADNDTLVNSGAVTVKARSYGNVGAEVDVGIGLTDSLASAEVESTANATGVYGGSGEDSITNYKTIAADALTVADAETEANIDLATEPEAKSEATAIAKAAGIDGGSLGEKTVDNYGKVTALANAGAWTRMHSQTSDKRAHSTGFGLAQSEAYGITSNSLDNTATNHDNGSIVVKALASTYDTDGNTGYSFAEEDANIDAGLYNETSDKWTPLSAKAAGILFSDGNDSIVNDGTVTVTSSTDGTIYADSNSYVRYPFSTARSVVFSQAMGLAAGKGENEVTNNGQLSIKALSYAAPKVYSWSRDYRATANAYGESAAEATGIAGDGTLDNGSEGVMAVTARATSWANAPTNSENATATADLYATASGFSPSTKTGLAGLLKITNNGQSIVHALAGEDANGNSEQIAWVNTNITSRDSAAYCYGTSTVDAAGVRAGDGLKEITNTGTLTVIGRARANLTTAGGAHTYARSYYYNPEANSYATGISTATGVLASGGENHVYNYGSMDVQAQTLDVYGWSDSYSSWSTCYSTAETHATSTGQGIVTGDGNDEIINTATLNVESSANSHSYAYADTRDNNLADEYETSRATSVADVTGIDAGDGSNTIDNQGSLSVSATALALVNYGGGHASVTATTSSTASAVGIYGGEDGSYINNSGSITATALAYYINGSPTLGASASGIVGGSGNDTIVNEGTIVTAEGSGVNGSVPTSTGIAIDAGAGNDTVVLGDGSITTGSVLLADGDDTLELRGTPIVNGTIDPGTGENSLYLRGAGYFEPEFSGYAHAAKFEEGTYTISRFSPVATLHVDAGTLRVNSDYQFENSGLFTTQVLSDGSHGKFEIIGTGELDGALSVSRENSFYAASRVYDIITADILNNAFTDVTLPESTTLLLFSMQQTPDSILIFASPQSFTTVATNRVEASIAAYLDRIGPSAQGDMAEVLKTFQLLPPQDFSSAFAGMSPANYGALTDIGHHVVQGAMQPIVSHLAAIHPAAPSRSFASLTPVLRSRNGYRDGLPARVSAGNSSGRQNAIGLWIDGFGRWGSQDASAGYAGYDFNAYGVTVGLDRFWQNWIIGASIENSNTDVDFDADSGDGTIQTLLASLYADFHLNDISLRSILTYGTQSYRNTRNVTEGSILREAASNHDAHLFSAYLQGEYTRSKGPWEFVPFGDLQYTVIDENGFSETGADSLNLIVDDKTTEAMVSRIGMRISRPCEIPGGFLVPKLSLAGLYDFNIDDRVITAGFSGAPNDYFSIDGQDIDRFGVAVDAALGWHNESGFIVSVNYSGEFRDSFRMHTVSGKVQTHDGVSTSIGFANNLQNGRPEQLAFGKVQIDF